MPQVLIICPETQKDVYTGMNLDWFTFDALELSEQSFECPECGEEHRWTKSDAFLRADGGGD